MRKSRKRYIKSSLLFTSIICCIIAVAFLLNGTLERSRLPERKTLYSFGGIKAAGDTPGFTLERGAVVETGNRAFCDLQFQAYESNSRFIISRNSKAQPRFVSEFFRNRNTIKIRLPAGEYFIKSEVVEPDLMIIQTPGARVVVGAPGGLFISVSRAGDEVHAIAGEAIVRPLHPQVDDLMSEVWSRSRILTQLETRLNDHALVLAAGNSVLIPEYKSRTPGETRGLLPGSPLLKKTSRNRIRGESDIRSLAAELDKHGKLFASIENLIRVKKKAWPEQKKPRDKVSDSRQRVISRLLFARGGETSQLYAKHGIAPERTDFVLNGFSNCLGRSLETLVLRNAKRHRGIIVSDQENYWVINLKGKKKYPRSGVDRVEF